MNDVLLNEIKTAYERLGMACIRRCFYLHEESGDSACPLVVLALARGVVDKDDPGIRIDGGGNLVLDYFSSQFSESWLYGYLDAFDSVENCTRNLDRAYMDGFAFGEKARQELSPSEPPE